MRHVPVNPIWFTPRLLLGCRLFVRQFELSEARFDEQVEPRYRLLDVRNVYALAVVIGNDLGEERFEFLRATPWADNAALPPVAAYIFVNTSANAMSSPSVNIEI